MPLPHHGLRAEPGRREGGKESHVSLERERKRKEKERQAQRQTVMKPQGERDKVCRGTERLCSDLETETVRKASFLSDHPV
jgi:hypothetical protein